MWILNSIHSNTNVWRKKYKKLPMRTKNFVLTLCVVVSVSLIFIIFGQQKPESIQNIVSTTNEQIRNFKVKHFLLVTVCLLICLFRIRYGMRKQKLSMPMKNFWTFWVLQRNLDCFQRMFGKIPRCLW